MERGSRPLKQPQAPEPSDRHTHSQILVPRNWGADTAAHSQRPERPLPPAAEAGLTKGAAFRTGGSLKREYRVRAEAVCLLRSEVC